MERGGDEGGDSAAARACKIAVRAVTYPPCKG